MRSRVYQIDLENPSFERIIVLEIEYSQLVALYLRLDWNPLVSAETDQVDLF